MIAERGLDGLVEGVAQGPRALQAAGFDAVMFGNENDRPYEFKVDTASTATMAYVIGRVRDEITRAVRRQRAVGSDGSMALAAATGARLRARDLHRHLCLRHGAVDARRRRGDALPRPARPRAISRCSTTSRPSSPIRSTSGSLRRPGALARCSRRIPDAILVSGAITGEAAAMSDLEAVKKVLPDTPVLANTGVKHATVADVLQDRRRLHRRLVAEGRRQHLERRRSGARGGIHAACPRGARHDAGDGARPSDRRSGCRRWLTELMLIPGLSGHEGRVRALPRKASSPSSASPRAPTGSAI